ncbi:MAG: low molecular weight phosphatase family protein [Parvularculaceae bacterium]|nr:low molecular weight phosphatase family protein [Parvularculaceae bacterium]
MVSSVLFVCNMNSVRSPMAEAVARHVLGDSVTVSSCGVYKGITDPFVQDALKEAGMAPVDHPPQEFAECNTDDFDVVIALTSEAAAEARKLGAKVEFWEVENPTDTRGSELDLRMAYGRLRDDLVSKVKQHLAV